MKYFIRIFGCQMNYSDAERIATVLENLDWQETKKLDDADLCLFLTCSVRQKSEDKVFGELKNLAKWKQKKAGRKIGISGCMVRKTSRQEDPKKDSLLNRSKEVDFVWKIEDSVRLPELLGEPEKLSSEKLDDYFAITPQNQNKFSVFIPIMTGCDNFCTYCIVPYTRGREKSRPAKEILAECSQAIKNGAKEITLLGQNVDSYQKTSGKPAHRSSERAERVRSVGGFAELLDQVAQIPDLKRLRFTSSHPKDFDDSVIAVMAKHQNIERHLHLPAQHGDDAILKKMNRKYTADEYLEKLAKFRKKLPEASVTTDLIVGFPGETEEQFENLLSFYRKANFDFAFFAKYSPRPETAAANFPGVVSEQIKSERWHRLNELMVKTTAKNYKKLLGKTLEVLVEGYQNDVCFGRSSEFYLTKFPGEKELIGKLVNVKITKPRDVELWGELI